MAAERAGVRRALLLASVLIRLTGGFALKARQLFAEQRLDQPVFQNAPANIKRHENPGKDIGRRG
jgi:hypothetical protein